MALTLPKIAADFEVALAAGVSVGQTTATVSSTTDKDGNALTNGTWCFTLDRNSSGKKEHIIATLTGVALSNVQSVNRQGGLTTGFARSHRLGANVIISDYAVLKRILDNLDGTTGFNSLVKLGYDGDAGINSSDLTKFATVKFVNDTAISGAPDATNSTKGITKLSVAAISPSNPIAVGDNDTRMLTQAENDAAQGTSGAPSGTNRYVTNDDTAETATASKVARRRSTGDVTVPLVPTQDTDAVSKAYIDTEGSTFVMGEAFTGGTTPQPARIINDLVQPFLDAESAVISSSVPRYALRIIPRENCTIATILVAGRWNGAGASEIVTGTIQTDSSGSPSGTIITNGTTGTLTLNTLTDRIPGYLNFNFSTPPSLVSGTTYWVVLTHSGGSSGSLSMPSYSVVTQYASFQGKSFNGSVWSSLTNIPAYELIPATGKSESVWICDANSNEQTRRAVDLFVTNTGSAGASAVTKARYGGQVSGFTGLETGIDYFLSNTFGTITKNKNEGVFVGTAFNATTLFVPKTRYKQNFNIITNDGSLTSQSNGFVQFLPIQTFTEDGILTGTINSATTTGGNTNPTVLNMGKVYSNGSRPNTYAVIRSNTGGGVSLATSPFSVPVKKGDRIIFESTISTSSQFSVSNLMFQPL